MNILFVLGTKAQFIKTIPMINYAIKNKYSVFISEEFLPLRKNTYVTMKPIRKIAPSPYNPNMPKDSRIALIKKSAPFLTTIISSLDKKIIPIS